MEGKINRDYLKSYSVSYTNNILDTAYKGGQYLIGRDLTTLCTPEQVNYNLLKNIFLQWEAEMSKLQSPYFDYSATIVQSALKSFMDVLSRNIKLDQGSLRPLLQQAVEETMYQVFQPLYYFENFLWPDQVDRLKIEEIVKLKRFVRINPGFLQELLKVWEADNKVEADTIEYQQQIARMAGNWKENWEPANPYVEAFSKVVSLQTESLWKTDDSLSEKKENGTSKNVNDQYSKRVVSLNEKLQKDQTTLADQHLNKKVENIKQSLTLNQKFMFVNELFAGNSDEFGIILDRIEKCTNYHEAIKILDDHSSERSQWDMESDAVKELIDLVSRRF